MAGMPGLEPDGTIVACRKSISAILLLAVYRDRFAVWGILHPEPARPMNIAYLPNVPFVRVSRWPIVDGEIGAGVGHRPSLRLYCAAFSGKTAQNQVTGLPLIPRGRDQSS